MPVVLHAKYTKMKEQITTPPNILSSTKMIELELGGGVSFFPLINGVELTTTKTHTWYRGPSDKVQLVRYLGSELLFTKHVLATPRYRYSLF